MYRVLYQLVNALVPAGRNGDERNTKHFRHSRNINKSAAGANLIHHIERHHHRNAKLHDLQRQVKVALQIGCVHNIDNAVRAFVDQKITRDDLF